MKPLSGPLPMLSPGLASALEKALPSIESLIVGLHDRASACEARVFAMTGVARDGGIEPIRVMTEEGKNGDVIGRATGGIVVLFSNPPTSSGNTLYMTRYERRTSPKTSKDYYKCFEFITVDEHAVLMEAIARDRQPVEEARKEMLIARNQAWSMSSVSGSIKSLLDEQRSNMLITRATGMSADLVTRLLSKDITRASFCKAFGFDADGDKSDDDYYSWSVKLSKKIEGGMLVITCMNDEGYLVIQARVEPVTFPGSR